MSKHQLTSVVLLVMLTLTAGALFGAVPGTMNYQGRLLDDAGDPVDGTVTITFGIYDDSTGGSMFWSETHTTVEIEDGLFSAILGSQGNPIPDSAFNAGEGWLGVMVNGEMIEPKTELTSTPFVFAAKSIRGDMTTEPGHLSISVVPWCGHCGFDISADTGTTRFIQMPSDDLNAPSMLMSTEDGVGSHFGMYLGDPDEMSSTELLSLTGDPTSGGSMTLYGYSPGKPDKSGGYLQLSAYDEGSDIAMVTNDLADVGRFAISATTPEAAMVDIQASQNLGGSLRLRIPSNDRDMLVLSGYGELGGRMEMYASGGGVPIDPAVFMGVEPTPFNTGILRMSDQEDGRTLLQVAADPSLGASLEIYEIDPGPVGNLLAKLSRGALTFYQGNCFGKGAMRTYYSECGSAFDTTGETLKVDMGLDREDYAAWYMYDGMKAGAMFVDETRVGIGLDSPTEDLVIGQNLGSYGGRRLVIGDNTGGTSTGLMVGSTTNRRGWMLWNVDDQYLEFGTKDTWGTDANTLVLNSGDVGIGMVDPYYKLDVSGQIRCTMLHETSDGRLKSNITELENALATLQLINGVSFEWNELSEFHGGTPGKQDVGVVADNIEDVLPDLVYTDNEGFKSVAYTKLVPVLIEAVKELDDKTARIEQLESQVDKLTSLVNEMIEMQK